MPLILRGVQCWSGVFGADDAEWVAEDNAKRPKPLLQIAFTPPHPGGLSWSGPESPGRLGMNLQ